MIRIVDLFITATAKTLLPPDMERSGVVILYCTRPVYRKSLPAIRVGNYPMTRTSQCEVLPSVPPYGSR